jgi:glycosyltransferase involved in cell wall biosynthesis
MPGIGDMIDEITPLIITYNEAPNIGRVLEKLLWARRIVVVDSGSTDGTQKIISRVTQAEIVTRTFDSFAAQCNFGLEQIKTEWVLSLDADYELSDEFVSEIGALKLQKSIAGYRASFIYRIYGKPLHGSLYPPRTVLYRARRARYENSGHGHRVVIAGPVSGLTAPIYHDDRKPLSRWFASQQSYAQREAEYLLSANKNLSRTDRLRRSGWIVPLLTPFYVLFVKGCILDGRAGWFYMLQRLLAEIMIALAVFDRRFVMRK